MRLDATSPAALGAPRAGPGSPAGGERGGTPGGAAGPDFGDALKQAVGSLGELGGRADASSLQLATGAPVDVHEVMLNVEQASLGFSLALQVRNKLVDAYQEVMRISV